MTTILHGHGGRRYEQIDDFQRPSYRADRTLTYLHTLPGRTTTGKYQGKFRIAWLYTYRQVVVLKTGGLAARKSLQTESEALRRLHLPSWLFWHKPIAPRLVEPCTWDEEAGCYFIAIELLDERKRRGLITEYREKWIALDKALDKTKALQVQDVLRLARLLYKGTEFMHRRGVVHGDIKPEHVLLRTKRGDPGSLTEIRLIDFGLSYVGGDPATWKGGSPGFSPTICWRDPYWRMDESKQRWLDQYGVAATLFWILTGETFPLASPAFFDLDLEAHRGDELVQRLTEYWQRRLIVAPVSPEEELARGVLRWLINHLLTREKKEDKPLFAPYLLQPTQVLAKSRATSTKSGGTTAHVGDVLWFPVFSLGLGMLHHLAQGQQDWQTIVLALGLCIAWLWRAVLQSRGDRLVLYDFPPEPKTHIGDMATFTLFLIMGSLVLPSPLLPALPGTASLYLGGRLRFWQSLWGFTALVLSAFCVWLRWSLIGVTGRLFLPDAVEMIIVVLAWLLGATVSWFRCRWEDWQKQLRMVLIGSLLSSLMVYYLILHMSPSEMFLGFCFSILYAWLGASYARWEAVNHALARER